VEVVLLSEMREPAAVAQTLYRETETSRELRLKLAEERKAMPYTGLQEGKPSKRNWRELDRLFGAGVTDDQSYEADLSEGSHVSF
jgi:ribosome-associated heat shock protein Hsp15